MAVSIAWENFPRLIATLVAVGVLVPSLEYLLDLPTAMALMYALFAVVAMQKLGVV